MTTARTCSLVAATLLVAALGACRAPQSAPPVTPQRPTFSTNANTTAEGSLELEAGGLLDSDDRYELPLTLKWGSSERTELFIGWSPYVRDETTSENLESIGDVLVGVRNRFHDETESGPAFAWQGAAKLPTADEDGVIGSGEVDFFGSFIATSTVGNGGEVTGYYQLGIIGQPGSDVDLQHGFAVAGGFTPPGRSLGGYAELAWVVDEGPNDPLFVTSGLTYTIGPAEVIDAGVVVGLDDDAPDLQFVIGMTRNLGRLAGTRRNDLR